MSLMKDFKSFALKGNVVDLAVAVIIGGAFGKIVASLVKDVIMPVVGLAMGGVDFSGLYVNLGEGSYESLAAAQEAGAAVLTYGVFMQNVVDFIIVAFVIFMMVRAIAKAQKAEEEAPAAPPEPSEDIVLLREIRDSLAAKP